MDWIYQSGAEVCRQLGAKLHCFLCDGLELIVSSSIHVEVILHDKEENTKVLISENQRKKDRRHDIESQIS